MSSRDALLRAYAEARYRIECSGTTIERRVGRVDGAADTRLAAAGCRAHWHIVTPCNPGSRPLDPDDNAVRIEALQAELDALRWRYLPAVNGDARDEWLEPGCCLLDVPRLEALALARRYGQLAIVEGRIGRAPELLIVA